MKTIKLIMILTWTIFLSSCKSQIVCSQIKSATIAPVPLCDISITFNRCRCRCMDVNKWDTLPLSECADLPLHEGAVSYQDPWAKKLNMSREEAINYPLSFCDGFAGFHFSAIASEIRPKVKQLNVIKEDNCK